MDIVAVLLNNHKETCSWQTNGTVILYEKSNGKWLKAKSIPYELRLDDYDLNFIRTYYTNLLSELVNCKIFVAKKISGFLINFLDFNGFTIYEFTGTPINFLDSILDSEKRKQEKKIFLQSQTIDMFAPQKVDKFGNYKLDLYKILQSNEKITSKQLIIPFLKKEDVKNLEIICDHIPKWFDKSLPEIGFNYQISSNTNELMTVNISPS
ncbi:Fe-only nitrogenase accessory protein AnfO [Clostridium saccharoperbutylacetonicum]|uniref:Iron only nitrogenase protein AnfO n=1 Tax=Clostridium saccharoperbutylacetonicum N1-4(HMT) TaxID=931276 RepID=M1MZR4_9CLOT|nr:Fe-only nitrogenase accessory AnfO family protein [Clostridium saccharoperbutylacetonicum]AGF56847.1 iron only nitrogenase protein AnfO [Clostridium saccharoperbutylacetonicum N1-4(HMT)]NRT62396.1 Fe-only nitrogenase accessory protein AnfO [Clostridium saccharoperbutylacetonicum]NSB25736.1 Fe-only nitrogenase accessory protein AnfO [Clostridium saccharoperbutylacetonicum]NSB45102.1 Fe-only nitrogenase accessory protein AnfO [Clostridium saccharoperbutylacetonicum]